jgi:hypothetical protein
MSLCISGCAVNTGLQNFAQGCQSDDEDAAAAEYPSPDLVAQHDQLEKQSHDLKEKALVDSMAGNSQASSQDIDQEVQDSEDADELYDYQSKQSEANQCWATLADLASTEQQQWVQQQEQISQDNASRSAALAAQLEQQPSPPPRRVAEVAPLPAQAPDPQQKTWMDTPYAAIVPPAIRGNPISDGTTGIPLIAQGAANQ